MLQSTMSDLEDTVEDGMAAFEVENDEIQQRLIILEETVIGMTLSVHEF